MRRLALAIIVLSALWLPAVTEAQEPCRFVLGFAALRDAVGAQKVGECLENERFNDENGNAEQRTSGGLMVWRKIDNFTAFTDGGTTWIAGPNGMQSRPNSERFSWEQDPVQSPPRSTNPVTAPAATSTPRTVAPPASQPATATPRPASPPASTARPTNTPTSAPPTTACCRRCTTGKACGDSCIQASRNCNVGRGCACDAEMTPDLRERFVSAMTTDDIMEEARLLEILNEGLAVGPCDDVVAEHLDLAAVAR